MADGVAGVRRPDLAVASGESDLVVAALNSEVEVASANDVAATIAGNRCRAVAADELGALLQLVIAEHLSGEFLRGRRLLLRMKLFDVLRELLGINHVERILLPLLRLAVRRLTDSGGLPSLLPSLHSNNKYQ